MSTTTSQHAVRELADRVTGAVHAPGSEGYEQGRGGVQLLDGHRPDAVVVAADAEDVRVAVTLAHRLGCPVSAQRTGHGQGQGMRGGILVDTHRLTGVRVDPERGTAHVPAGALWQEVIEAAAPHGLAPLSGSSPRVGALSYTLGGGVGLLARRHGFAADHVRRVDLTLPDGRSHSVTADTEPELFWAVRGAGCSLGVATSMEIDLFPVARLYGGSLFLDATHTPHILETWRAWTATVPEELTSGMSVMAWPDMEGVPDQMRGRTVAQVSVAWSGPLAEGPAWVEPLRSAAPVLMDTMGELPYTESGAIFDEHHDRAGFAGRSVLVDDLPEEAGVALLSTLAEPTPFMGAMSLRHLGGALARPPHVPNAVGHRGAAHALTVLTLTGPEEPVDTERMHVFREEAAALLSDHVVGRSTTLAFGPQGPEEVREAFDPVDHRRLVDLYTRLDPGRVLHSHRPLVWARPGPGPVRS